MNSRLLTIILGVAVVLSLGLLLTSAPATIHLPDNQIGYEPEQPIAYSHRLHAGELGIQCQHCHVGAERSRDAGIPSANVCMNCHRFITASSVAMKAEADLAVKEHRAPRTIASPELRKLFAALGQANISGHDTAAGGTPIAWTRVHNLPSFVSFNHGAHVVAGVTCQTCHGPVETMERVRQVADLSMGWCVNCHRNVNASGVAGKRVNATTDCDACHH